MAFDLDAYIKELGITGDDEKAVRTALGTPERLKYLEGNQLRQSDYSKQMNELSAARTSLKEADDRVTAEMAEWARIQAEGGAVTKKMQDDLHKAEQRALTLQQRVSKIATEAGLDPVKALEGIDQPPPRVETPPAPVIDPKQFVSPEQFSMVNKYMFDLATELPMIAQEHFELTGQRLDTRAMRAEIEKRSRTKGAVLDPRVVWEETNNIPTIRATKATEQRELERKQDEQRGYERARTEAALPVPPSQGVHSPMLRTSDGNPRKSILERPAPEGGVRSAASALATGKYRNQPTGATQ
jgi:hypothetical protein